MTESRVYTLAAIVAIAVMFAGFAPTYYLKSIYGTRELNALGHVHGLIMTAWFLLFLVQAQLVARNHVIDHRRLGIAGAVIAALVVVSGIALAVASAPVNQFGVPPKLFLVLPLGELFIFVGLVVTALILRSRPEYHRRLMLLATLSMLVPAIARLPIEFLYQAGPPAAFALADILILAFVAHDTARNRRLHPAYVAGLAFVTFVQFGRLALSRTALWDAFASWAIG